MPIYDISESKMSDVDDRFIRATDQNLLTIGSYKEMTQIITFNNQ